MPARILSKKELTFRAIAEVLAFIVMMTVVYRLTSGRWDYWQGWVYIALLVIPLLGFLAYLIRHDPELLSRRMQYSEKEKGQKWIVTTAGLLITLTFILPGIDIRFGWSHVPVPVVIAAEVVVLAGYALYYLVMRENTYLSRIVEVEDEQKVIRTGPYAVVRHPMYDAMILMFLATPLALGSFWMLIPAVLTIPMLAVRAVKEEELLKRDLPGYTDYMQKTRYRLVPGVW